MEKSVKDGGKRTSEKFQKKHYTKKPYKTSNPKEKLNGDVTHPAEFNDYKWYVEDQALAEAASKLNWGVPLGSAALQKQTGLDNAFTYNSGFTNIPGLAQIRFSMLPGISDNANSPINMSARNLFAAIRRTVTSSLPFGAADIMSLLIAEDSIFAYYAYLTRLYGTIAHYSALNRYIGRAVIEASGVNYANLVSNSGKLLYYIQKLRVRINEYLYMPQEFGFVKRHHFMCNAVYTDADTRKSQLFVFVPEFFYRWQSFGDSELTAGSHCTPLLFYTGTGDLTVDQLISYGESLLAEFMGDDDVATMISMLRRTYGDDKSWKVAEMPDDYAIAPIYSENLLGQIHNAHIVTFPNEWFQVAHGNEMRHFKVSQRAAVPTPGGYNDFYIVSGEDLSMSSERCTAHNLGLMGRQYMDTYNPVAATFDEIIDNSRAMVTFTHTPYVSFDGNVPILEQCDLKSCGLDIWTHMYLYNLSPDQQSLGSGFRIYNTFHYAVDVFNDIMVAVGLASAFDWMPRILVYGTYTVGRANSSNEAADKESKDDALREGSDTYAIADFWDYNNPSVIPGITIESLHEACQLGAFKVAVEGNAWR